jgi:hypothetical protein
VIARISAVPQFTNGMEKARRLDIARLNGRDTLRNRPERYGAPTATARLVCGRSDHARYRRQRDRSSSRAAVVRAPAETLAARPTRERARIRRSCLLCPEERRPIAAAGLSGARHPVTGTRRPSDGRAISSAGKRSGRPLAASRRPRKLSSSGSVARRAVGTAASFAQASSATSPATRSPSAGRLPSAACCSTTPATSQPRTVSFWRRGGWRALARLSETARTASSAWARFGRGGSSSPSSSPCGADGLARRARSFHSSALGGRPKRVRYRRSDSVRAKSPSCPARPDPGGGPSAAHASRMPSDPTMAMPGGGGQRPFPTESAGLHWGALCPWSRRLGPSYGRRRRRVRAKRAICAVPARSRAACRLDRRWPGRACRCRS